MAMLVWLTLTMPFDLFLATLCIFEFKKMKVVINEKI